MFGEEAYTFTIAENAESGGEVGLVGTITASYFDSTVNNTLTEGDEGKTTSELQTPTAYGTGGTDIYMDWNVDVDGVAGADDPWDLGTTNQYPVLKVDFNNDGNTSDDVTRQRQ